ncbi:MAG: hypothetical protein R2735_01285 [Microthrixaceae bacterium]
MKLPFLSNRFFRNRVVINGARLMGLVALVAISGAVAGLAIGVPLGRVSFSSSKAVRLDQARLAGSIDPEAALVTSADLPVGWKAGDASLAGFGILANDFCGEKVEMPSALSETKAAVFVNESGSATLISQAVRVEKWQDAREYIRDVDRVLGECDKFFQVDPEGKRLRVDVKTGQGEPPITDYVGRTYVAEDGSAVQAWSIMAIGDVVVGLRHLGKSAPQHSFMSDVQNHILMRTAPQTFAPGSGDTRSEVSTTVPDGSQTEEPSSDQSTTTVLESGSADEPTDTSAPTVPPSNSDQGDDTGGASGDEPRD